MDLSLRAVTKDNYEAVCELNVTEAQKQYVASNLWSLVEAAFNDGYQTRAIYLDDEPVGFFMWVYEDHHKISIWRFMIAQKFQRKNIGRTALQMLLTELAPVFAEVPGLKPEVMRFDAARGELRLQVTAPGFTEIERFRELAGKRFEVQQGEVRSTEGKVEGALVLKGKSS